MAAMALAVVHATLRGIDSGLDMVSRRYAGEIIDRHGRYERRFYTSFCALRRVVAPVAVLGGVGAVIVEVGWFDNLGYSLLASAGVITVTLGVAAQAVPGNILAGLQITIAKPVRIGDSVLCQWRWPMSKRSTRP